MKNFSCLRLTVFMKSFFSPTLSSTVSLGFLVVHGNFLILLHNHISITSNIFTIFSDRVQPSTPYSNVRIDASSNCLTLFLLDLLLHMPSVTSMASLSPYILFQSLIYFSIFLSSASWYLLLRTCYRVNFVIASLLVVTRGQTWCLALFRFIMQIYNINALTVFETDIHAIHFTIMH